MPADGGAGAVFRYQDVLQRRGPEPRESGRALSQRQEKCRDVVGLLKRTVVEVIPPAERDHPAFAEEAVELEVLERERLDVPHQLLFVIRRNQLRLMFESLR